MKNFELIRNHLADNTGDENISKMVWVVIVFVVGALIMGVFTTVFNKEELSAWLSGNLDDLLSGSEPAHKLGS